MEMDHCKQSRAFLNRGHTLSLQHFGVEFGCTFCPEEALRSQNLHPSNPSPWVSIQNESVPWILDNSCTCYDDLLSGISMWTNSTWSQSDGLSALHWRRDKVELNTDLTDLTDLLLMARRFLKAFRGTLLLFTSLQPRWWQWDMAIFGQRTQSLAQSGIFVRWTSD